MIETQEHAKIQPEVELDLDDAKEQDIQVETKEEKSKEPNLNSGEVDLGYTSHGKEDNKEELSIEQIEEQPVTTKPKEEPKKEADNLSEINESVQKRIDKLTRRYREAERREQAALEFAKGLHKKYETSEKRLDTADEQYLKEFDARVDAQREQVRIKLRTAIESNDADAIMQANDELTQLAVQKEKAKLQMADRTERLRQLEEQKKIQASEIQEQQRARPVDPAPSGKAKTWAQKNTWFGNDKIMTNAAFTIHEDLVGMGVDVESEEYYNEIDKRMKDNFPHKFSIQEQRREPVQQVASAGRQQQGRRTVRLTKSQVAIAKKLGVPLEEYAKYVKEVQ
jgi:hypothetical protein|tara:strand:+ start:1343 stop:2359 length:1017 start_codon:yes stop_codon:yes gene_type:complete